MLPEGEKHPLNKLIRVNFSPASAFPFLSALFSLNLGFLILKMNFSFCVYFSFAGPTSSDEEATVDAVEEIARNAAEEAAKITAEEAAKIAAEEAAKTAANSHQGDRRGYQQCFRSRNSKCRRGCGDGSRW